jgi:hypothetical protein
MKVAFVFPPAWAPWAPSYAMALFAGGLRREGHNFLGYDLNIELYRAFGETAETFWRDDHAPSCTIRLSSTHSSRRPRRSSPAISIASWQATRTSCA